MHCKLLWIKASAKCINVNVLLTPAEMLNNIKTQKKDISNVYPTTNV